MRTPKPEAYQRVLVIKPRHFGDVLLSTPVFAALKEHRPASEIFAAVNFGTQEILVGNPHLTGVLQAPPARGGAWLARWKSDLRFVREVRRHRFDLVVDLTTSDRSAILTRLSGAPRRIGYRSFKGFKGRGRCYNEIVQPERQEHIVLKHVRLVRSLGVEVTTPRLHFGVSDSARRKLDSLLPLDTLHRDFFQVHPVSRVAKKNWSVAHLAKTVNWIAARGWLPVITGSADAHEQAWIRELRQALPGEHLDLSGRLTFEELGALSERARCFIGVDTAPMHIAAAMNTPVIGIFGPTSERMWAPWCETKLILSREDLNCRMPCRDKHHCPHIECLRDLTPEMCLPRIERFLLDLKLA